VIAGIGKSQYNRNIVLTTMAEFDATLLQNHEEILEKFFQFKFSKIDAKLYKILIYNVPIAEFSSNNGMESVTGMVHRSAYLCRNVYGYGGACIRPAAPFRLGLAPHLPLAKISADP
jgi:hypothetical protein